MFVLTDIVMQFLGMVKKERKKTT